ncbi:mannitol dehydrogenase family protein [Ilumatobacter nonamiensis]|uniref:mannitol dehydrogenase family protein n=1 Tax=Ilumatobacter nonamiensis TaxID=467093 RepID=UPI00034DEED5|nr:mannitol dehydrogenase family protein [Ilumatobacter nonamiensis]
MSTGHVDRVPVDLADGELAEIAQEVSVPRYDRGALRRSIVHVGVGGFHRAHLAAYVDDLCRLGNQDWSIVGSGVTAADSAMADALTSQRGLYTLIERGASRTSTRVIGSLVDYVLAASRRGALVDRLIDPDVRVASLTITEGGYPVDEHSGEFDPTANATAFDILVEALAHRRDRGIGPLTVLSCDNVIGNGTVARTSMVGTAGLCDPDLARWIEDEVAFPNSMVDRITPATTDADRAWLRDACGVIDRWPVVAEPFRQWALENSFVGEAPPFADVGVLMTTDVEPYELLKLRLLNASHSCLAYLAALAGFEHVDKVMGATAFRTYVERFMHEEAIPALPNVPGVDVDAYADELLERFSNPAIGDQIARLCLDGSSKFPKFLLPTLRTQLATGGSIRFATLALAGWYLYLRGADDRGNPLEISHDPRRDELSELSRATASDPRGFLRDMAVFGDDLGRDDRFCAAFATAVESLNSAGVRSTLGVAVNEERNGRDAADE